MAYAMMFRQKLFGISEHTEVDEVQRNWMQWPVVDGKSIVSVERVNLVLKIP